MKRVSILFVLSIAPPRIFAHTGHGGENPLSLSHYVVNTEHYLPIALTVVLVLSALAWYRKYLIKE